MNMNKISILRILCPPVKRICPPGKIFSLYITFTFFFLSWCPRLHIKSYTITPHKKYIHSYHKI